MTDEHKSALDALDEGPKPSDPELLDAPTDSDADPTEHPTVAALVERYGDDVTHMEVVSGDEYVVHLAPERNREILRWLFEEEAHDYKLLRDVTCVDPGDGRPLQVVYNLFSLTHKRALRLKCLLPVDGDLEIDSVVPIWEAANWLEREVYDLFGVTFRDHPDLRRILMPHDYAEGHPLRKDFPLRGRFSRAEQTKRALAQDVDRFYIPAERAVGREPQEVHFPDPNASEADDASGADDRA